jgi:hypothetical protein
MLLIPWHGEEDRILEAEGGISDEAAQALVRDTETLTFLAAGARGRAARGLNIDFVKSAASSLNLLSA